MGHDYCGSNPGCKTNGHPFPPPCGEENDPCGASGKENGCKGLAQGLCSGEWCAAVSSLLRPSRLEACGEGLKTAAFCRMNNITIYDSLKVPDVAPGEYVLGFRWCASLSRR